MDGSGLQGRVGVRHQWCEGWRRPFEVGITYDAEVSNLRHLR